MIKVVQRRGSRSRTRELTFSFFSACGGKLTRFLLYLSFCVSEFCFSCRHVVDFMAVQENPKLVDKFEQPKLPGLPDPNNAATPTEGSSCKAANKEIESVFRKSSPSSSKRGPYARYSPEERLAMAKYASLHALAAASRHVLFRKFWA